MEGHLIGECFAITILFKHTQGVSPSVSYGITGAVVLAFGLLIFFLLKKKDTTLVCHCRVAEEMTF